MGSLARKLQREKLKKMKGNNCIGGAWRKYKEMEKAQKEKVEKNDK